MLERRKQEDDIAAATGRRPMPDQDIMEEVLGHRSGYRRGFGYGMPIDEHRVEYYEQPRDEYFVHSEFDRPAYDDKLARMQQQIDMLMSMVRAPSMSAVGQYPPFPPSAPHMGTSSSGPDPSQPSFAPFTPAVPPPYPYPGFYGLPGHPATFPQAPHDPSRGSPSSSRQQRADHPPSGFQPWPGGVGGAFAPFSSQTPAFGSYPFPGATTGAHPSSSQQPIHTPAPPSPYHPTPGSTSSSPMSQSTNVRGTGRARQRQHQRH